MNDIQLVENGEDEMSDSADLLYDDKRYCTVRLTHGFINGHDYHKVNDSIELHRKIDGMTDSKEADEQRWNSSENKRKRIDISGRFINTTREHNDTTNSFRRTRKTSREELPELNDELLNGYKILQHLMSPTNKNINSLFMDRNDAVKQFSDYCDTVREPMWLNKVKTQLLSGKYNTITEVVHDIRLILENCYDYYGNSNVASKRALKLEFLLEQKLALLPREMREKTTLEATSPLLIKAAGNLVSGTRPPVASSDTSQMLFYVTNSKLWKEKTNRKRHLEEKKAVKEANYVNVIEWEKQLTQEHLTAMKAMWELPQIGHFLFLAQSALNIPELHMYELERIFLMPRESRYLAAIITSLLSTPFQRTKLHQRPPMPYRIWKERVKLRIDSWYKFYYNRRSTEKVFKAYGVEPDFFRVMGEVNPFEEKEFHELSFHQRVWVVKSLCDYCLHTHKTVQDAINENSLSDQKEFVLGMDRSGKSYVHFPQFCGQDLRIYCQSSSSDLPVTNILPCSKPILNNKAEISNGINLAIKNGDIGKIKRKSNKKNISVQPDIKKFELIVDGVESLRQLISKFSISKDILLSKNSRRKEKQEQSLCELYLCERLYNLLDELERWESKLQNVVKRTQMRLKQEFDDYQTMTVAGEEDVDDIWGAEPDEEEQHPLDSPCGDISNSEDDLSINLYDSDSSVKQTGNLGQRRRRTTRKRYSVQSEDDENESPSSDFEKSFSCRGRLRKARKTDIDDNEYMVKTRAGNQNYKSSNSVSNCHIMKDYISNSTHEAKGQYEWETLRQIIISSADTETNEGQSVSEEVGQTKGNHTGSSCSEPSKNKQCIEQKSDIICQQENREKSDINYEEGSKDSLIPESAIVCQQENVIEENSSFYNRYSPDKKYDGNCHQENVEESNINSCQQDITMEEDCVKFESSDLQAFNENCSEILTVGNNVEIDTQPSVEIATESSEIPLQNTTVSEGSTDMNLPSKEQVTPTIEAQFASEIIPTDTPDSSETASKQSESGNSKSVKLTASRPLSRLKSSGLFLHIPPREVVYGTEQAISNKVTNNQVANLANTENNATKENERKQESLVTKNKTADQMFNKVKSRRTGKGPQNYQVFNFKLPSKPASTSPKLDRSLFQPASNQLNCVKHLIPAVDQKGNKIFLQYVVNMPVQAANNDNKQDRQKTQSPLIVNMPVSNRIVLSNNINASPGSVPFLLPVKHSGITTSPAPGNSTNSARNVVLSTSGSALQGKPSVSLLPSNTQSQTILLNSSAMNTAVVPSVTFQQSNTSSSPVCNTQMFLKVAQNTQNSANIALLPQLKSNPTSTATINATKAVPTTSHSVRLKSGPPPLGPITSIRKASSVSSAPKEPNVKLAKSASVGLENSKGTFLQIPPLGPITSPTSLKLKSSSEEIIKSSLLSQTAITSATLSNSIQNSAICSQSVAKITSTVSSNNNQFNFCNDTAGGSVTASKTPLKLMVPPTIPNSNYQFIMTPPSSTVPPTHVILSCSNIATASASTSSNSVILLPPTAKSQTVVAAAPTITVPAAGNNNRTTPNILTKQPSKTLAKTPVLLTNNSSVLNLPANFICEKNGIRTVDGAAVLNASPNSAKTVISTKKQDTNSVQYNPQQLFLLTSNGQLMQLNKIDTKSGNQMISANEKQLSTQPNVSYVLSQLPSQVLGNTTELKNL